MRVSLACMFLFLKIPPSQGVKENINNRVKEKHHYQSHQSNLVSEGLAWFRSDERQHQGVKTVRIDVHFYAPGLV